MSNPWDETREHPDDYNTWTDEVRNGDTLLGFHEWRHENGEGSTLETDLPLFTVVGYWDDDDKRRVTGVLAGEHSITGGDDVSEGGPFAVLVNAEDEGKAEALVEGSDESTEGIE